MQKLRRILGACADITWAWFAIWLARRGILDLGQAILKTDDIVPAHQKLPHRIRTRLAAAVGWQEGTNAFKAT